MPASFTITKLSASKLAAIQRRAKYLGLTVDAYLLQLVEADLSLEKEARTTPLEVLTAPFTKAFKGMTAAQLDEFVDRARRIKPHKRTRD